MNPNNKAARIAQVLEHHWGGELKAAGMSGLRLTQLVLQQTDTVTVEAAQSAAYLDDIVQQAGTTGWSFKNEYVAEAAKAYVATLVFGDLLAAVWNVVGPEIKEDFQPNNLFTIDLIRALATDEKLYK